MVDSAPISEVRTCNTMVSRRHQRSCASVAGADNDKYVLSRKLGNYSFDSESARNHPQVLTDTWKMRASCVEYTRQPRDPK